MTNATALQAPFAAVDSVIYTVRQGSLQVLLKKRSRPPFQDSWSLVGGYVHFEQDDNLEATAKRKLKEKTGVETPYLEQFYTIGNQHRDPRGWSLTTVYFALIPEPDLKRTTNITPTDLKWFPITHGGITEKLAFDHNSILAACTQRLKNKVLYTSLPLHLMPPTFTLNELQSVYEAIIQKKLDAKSFRRRMHHAQILTETGELRQTGKRPAMLYQPNQPDATYFFHRTIEGSPNDAI